MLQGSDLARLLKEQRHEEVLERANIQCEPDSVDYIRVCAYVHVLGCVCICARVLGCVHMCTCVRVCAYVHVLGCVHMCTC